MVKVADMELGDTYHSKAQRLQALGDIRTCPDPLLKKIQENAEQLFPPKALRDWGDWLKSHNEVPQTFNLYNRAGVRNEITPVRNIIYFHVIDEQIKPEFLAKLKKYCEAFTWA